MRIVVKIGGSVIASPLNAERIIKYSEVLKSMKEEGHDVVVVVGGGKVAREFISIADEIGLPDREKDEVAILVSRLNAKLVSCALGEYGSKSVPSATEEVSDLLSKGKVVVMGGLKPGITTDTVAAIVLEAIGSRFLIKATDQDGIYDKDPRRHPNAKKLDKLSYRDLHKIVTKKSHKPGSHQILDLQSIEILERQKAKVIVTNGLDPGNILAVLRGSRMGTTVEAN